MSVMSAMRCDEGDEMRVSKRGDEWFRKCI